MTACGTGNAAKARAGSAGDGPLVPPRASSVPGQRAETAPAPLLHSVTCRAAQRIAADGNRIAARHQRKQAGIDIGDLPQIRSQARNQHIPRLHSALLLPSLPTGLGVDEGPRSPRTHCWYRGSRRRGAATALARSRSRRQRHQRIEAGWLCGAGLSSRIVALGGEDQALA